MRACCIGNFIYENNVLKRILFEEGVIEIENGDINMHHYNYFIKDHLGNTRAVCEPDFNTDGSLKTTPIVHQHNSYYPFGMLHGGITTQQQEVDKNHYLYNGKEAQARKFTNYGVEAYTNLNWIDYGWRMYDITGRFTTIDPLAEKYYSISPYAYVANNPVKYIDPDGMSISPIYDPNGNFLGTDEDGFSGQIIIMNNGTFERAGGQGMKRENTEYYGTKIQDAQGMTEKVVSKIYTDVVDKMEGVSKLELFNQAISVYNNKYSGIEPSGYNSPQAAPGCGEVDMPNGTYKVTMNINSVEYLNTVENAQNTLGAHELEGHGKMGLKTADGKHNDVYSHQMKHYTWKNTTKEHKERVKRNYNDL